ncbi:MAG: NlpC-P60 family protein [Lysobacteraceae bacterium]|nr:MAG: NlpC-P60 family protein [Xanthomonadaceae bacterium]
MRRQRIALPTLRILALALALVAMPGIARDPSKPVRAPMLPVPASGVIGVEDAYFAPTYWISRLRSADQVLMDRAAIDARNIQLLATDDSMFDLAALPATLARTQVAGWIEGLASPPTKPLWDEAGKPVAKPALDAIVANRAMAAIQPSQSTRYGMAVERTALRAFPASLRVFNSNEDADIDRFQESALFPGDPVAIVHASSDGQWLFVLSPRYAAWVEARAIAEGDKESVLGFGQRAPYRVVTGAKPSTVFTREEPRVSELQLDMGVRIPLADAALDKPVNGQHPYSSWILELPVRNDDGRLAFAPALLQRNADSAADYLPLTRANLIRQSFKFLGERYGWGHSYNARDCSGFVSEVYRSMGVQLPRNTSDQAVSPVFARTHFEQGDSREKRMAAVEALDVGDLIYIPGHVMMFVGRIDGMPWVIHDTNGGSYLGADGKPHSMHLNGVSLTPLLPLRFGRDHDYVDRITNIVRVTHAR